MGWYMLSAKLTRESVQGLVAKPHDRKPVVAKLVESLGGKLHHYFFTFGEKDVVLIMEMPNNEAAMAVVLAAAATGSVTDAKTTLLTPSADAVKAMKKAHAAGKAYTPPKGKSK